MHHHGYRVANTLNSGIMQKFPLRNRCNRTTDDAIGDGNHNRDLSTSGTQLHRKKKSFQPLSAGTVRPASRPKSATTKICNRVYSKNTENPATWDEVLCVGCKSKSLPSPVSSSLVDSNTPSAVAAIMSETAQEPMQQTSAEILEVPCNATASPNNNTTSTSYSSNKDDNNNNRHRSRSHSQQEVKKEMQTEPGTASALAREFMTFERLRLGDQINFLLFDPYRTLKFLITELKSRLRTVVPDDINVQKILVEIQQTMKRIRIPNATEPMPPHLPRTMSTMRTRQTTTTITGAPAAAPVECILPKERCHVIKEDPLINHARKVNSSCQTMVSQLVKACQMCEHQIKQGPPGCNQNEINGNSNAEDSIMVMDVTGVQQRSEDRRKDKDVERCFSYKSLQDAIENLKIKSNPFSDDTQKIITQLETELLNFQRELQQNASSLSSSHRRPLDTSIKSTAENSKVQCKRLLNEEGAKAEHEQNQEEEEEETFPDFIAKHPSKPLSVGKKLDSATQAAAITTAKESQTNLRSSTQMLCHFEKEKLLLLQKFRTSEMQNIQGDLNELHVFVKDQLDGIYHSITNEHENLKYHSTDSAYKSKTNRQKIHRTLQRPEKKSTTGLLSSSSTSPSLTALTSSVLSSTEMQGVVGAISLGSSISPGHYNKNSSPKSPPIANDEGNANKTKSMTNQKQKQKSSSSSLSAANANEMHDISDVHKTNKALGDKKSNNRQCSQHQPCDGKKLHCSAVECEGCFPHNAQGVMTTDAVRTSTRRDIKSRKKTSLATMTCHQHRQQCHQQPTMTTTIAAAATQEQSQLISSSLPVAAPYISMQQAAADEPALNLDAAVTNAAVKTIIENAYATTATAAQRSDGIRMHQHKHCQSYQANNSWQRVNLKNPTGCQLGKKYSTDGYECRINSNRSNYYTEIHDCQKCRANSISPFGGGLCSGSPKMHEVGSATATASDDNGCDRNDGGAGGDGPTYCDKGCDAAVLKKDFTCHTGQRKQAGKPNNRATSKAAFQRDVQELKEFLDEIILLTP